MFNPKSTNLLDEQLATSGLEMNWGFAAIGAAVNVVGGIMGMNQASKNNSKAKKNAKKQKAFNKKVAKKTNEYNEKADENQKENYYEMRDFNHKVAMENWERGKEIHDYEFDSAMKQYEKSQSIGNAQLGLNTQEAANAVASEERSLYETFLEKQFSTRDSKIALEDELKRQELNQQSIAAERKNVSKTSSLERRGLSDKLRTAYETTQLGVAQQKSKLDQTYATQSLDTRQQLASLSGTLTQQNINKQEQYAQMRSISSRKKTGTSSIENTIEQLTSQSNIQKQTSMIEGLVAEGQASLGQAGKSTAKAKQSARAALQRNLMEISADLSGKRKQAGIQLAELNAELSLAETGVGLNLQRIAATISGAQQTTGLNIDRINTGVRGAEEDARLNVAQLRTDMEGTARGIATQMQQSIQSERFATSQLGVKAAEVNQAIFAANRDYYNNRQIIDLNYESAKKQTEMNIKDIGIQKEFADLNARASMMLEPVKLDYNPKPRQPPEHIFIDSMKAIPGFTPSPAMQNIYAPLVQGVGAAAGQLASADFSTNFLGQRQGK